MFLFVCMHLSVFVFLSRYVSVLITYVLMAPINVRAHVSREISGLKFGLSLSLLPNIVYPKTIFCSLTQQISKARVLVCIS